jgi:DNA-directed RNA polymerase subunit K/omega
MMTQLYSFEDVRATYDASKNTTLNIMSKYEKAKIVGMRMEQLARGAEPCCIPHTNDIRLIALQELDERQLPFMLVRELPNGIKEYWKLEDLIILSE